MNVKITNEESIKLALAEAVGAARENDEGEVASYIPELASVDDSLTGVALRLNSGKRYFEGDMFEAPITLQSTAKLVVLIGLLEELGHEQIRQWVKVEPSGDEFSSLARLDKHGPKPSNPMLNAGAIALCSHVPGNAEERLGWVEAWMGRLFGERLLINTKVFASERRTGDRNRALAYLLKNNQVLGCDVDEALETYFALCSYEVNLKQAVYLPWLLANGGINGAGEQVIKPENVCIVNAIMATCGLYNETGTHLVRTGLPAKSGVSGLILACAPNYGGIAVASPRVNQKGTSVRGELILEKVSKALGLHFSAVSLG